MEEMVNSKGAHGVHRHHVLVTSCWLYSLFSSTDMYVHTSYVNIQYKRNSTLCI